MPEKDADIPAQEMTAISLILTNTPLSHKARQETIDPMVDVACYTYVNRCSSTYASLRCLLVIVELLRVRGGSCVDDAAKFAMRARETHGLGPIGHALITERVGDCYAVREGTGSKALGSRRRKAAMWRMLAAKEWVAEGKPGRARHCLDGALPVYERSNFSGIVAFVEGLKEAAGYTPLISVGDETPEVESERLELGSKRKSMVTPEVDGLALNDDFVESQGGGGYF